jgi:hypothetical protein
MLNDVLSSTDASGDPLLGALSASKEDKHFFSRAHRQQRHEHRAADAQRSASRREKVARSRGSHARGVSKLIEEIQDAHREIHQVQGRVEARRQREEERLVALYGREAYDRARQAAEAKWGVVPADMHVPDVPAGEGPPPPQAADDDLIHRLRASAVEAGEGDPGLPVPAYEGGGDDSVSSMMREAAAEGLPGSEGEGEAGAVGELMRAARDAARVEALDAEIERRRGAGAGAGRDGGESDRQARARARMEAAAADRDVVGKLFQLPAGGDAEGEGEEDDEEAEYLALAALLREGQREREEDARDSDEPEAEADTDASRDSDSEEGESGQSRRVPAGDAAPAAPAAPQPPQQRAADLSNLVATSPVSASPRAAPSQVAPGYARYPSVPKHTTPPAASPLSSPPQTGQRHQPPATWQDDLDDDDILAFFDE